MHIRLLPWTLSGPSSEGHFLLCTDYSFVGQPPQYIYEVGKKDPSMMEEVEVRAPSNSIISNDILLFIKMNLLLTSRAQKLMLRWTITLSLIYNYLTP